MKSVLENFSCESSNGLGELFSDIFSCDIAKSFTRLFTLSTVKQRYYITDAVGPYFHKILLEDCCESFYSLCFDEIANSADKKEL